METTEIKNVNQPENKLNCSPEVVPEWGKSGVLDFMIWLKMLDEILKNEKLKRESSSLS